MSVLTPAELMDLVARHGARPGADLCAIAAALSESGGDSDATGDNGHSIGLWQMYDQGLGAGMSVADRADPDTAAAVMVGIFNANYADALRQGYSGEQLVRYCCMYTERPYGFPDLNCPAADRYVASWRAAVAALSGEEPATMTYDPETPPERQVQGWACSIRTATWMLKSLGGTLDAGAVQDLMVPQYVSPARSAISGSIGRGCRRTPAPCRSALARRPCTTGWPCAGSTPTARSRSPIPRPATTGCTTR
jgi:hypothetical protein